MYYYDILSVVAFLISHFLFKDNMVYSLICQFNIKGNRVYNEVYMADY